MRKNNKAMWKKSMTVWVPKYALAQHFLRIMDGTSYTAYKTMWDDITSQAGNKQNPVDWSDPDSWIPCKLKKYPESRETAARLWRKSENLINPRWSYELCQFARSYQLVEIQNDSFVLSPQGKQFTDSDETIIKGIDENEAVLFLLSEIADKGPGARKDLIGGFTRYCHRATTWSDTVIVNGYMARLNNLLDRNLVAKSGKIYQITDEGLAYLQRAIGSDDPIAFSVALVVNQQNSAVRQELSEFLQTVDPRQFERLVARLYEAMGYDNVEVTPFLHDQGVDVKADIEFGISSVHEIIQVKRQKGRIGQPIVSMLRGAMPLFNALRGSIVTTGGFSKKAKEIAVVHNAPPITLIDGETLLDLLIEHNIGVRRREIRILEFDAESLSPFDSEVELAAAALEEPESE